MLKIYVCLVWFPDFTMLKMVCVLIVQLPIHVMNRAPEEKMSCPLHVLVHSFFILHFDVTKMFMTSQIE